MMYDVCARRAASESFLPYALTSIQHIIPGKEVTFSDSDAEEEEETGGSNKRKLTADDDSSNDSGSDGFESSEEDPDADNSEVEEYLAKVR